MCEKCAIEFGQTAAQAWMESEGHAVLIYATPKGEGTRITCTSDLPSDAMFEMLKLAGNPDSIDDFKPDHEGGLH